MLADGFNGDVGFCVAAHFVACKFCSGPESNWVDSRKPHVVAWGRRVTLRHLDHQNANRSSLDNTVVLACSPNGICRQSSPLYNLCASHWLQLHVLQAGNDLLNPGVSCMKGVVLEMSRAMRLLQPAYSSYGHLSESIQGMLIQCPSWPCTLHPCADHRQASCHISRNDRRHRQTLSRLTYRTALHSAAKRNNCGV